MASQRPKNTTASLCSADTEPHTHIFTITNYSLHCIHGVSDRQCLLSKIFTVGGHAWRIRYCPDGKDDDEEGKGYVSVYLELTSDEFAKVRLMYEFSLVNQRTGKPWLLCSSPTPFTAEVGSTTWGTNKFIKTSELVPPYLCDDRLVIKCSVTVIKGSSLRETAITSYFDVQVPPSNLPDDLGKLFEDGEGVDITFKVKREFFGAHRIVLAVRSPVFKEDLYATIRDKRMQNRTIEGMEPTVFKGLLHFIYTDSLPPMDNQNENEREEMVKHLFAAADRYDMERMKLVCGSFLSGRLNVESVTTTIALAHKHRCTQLKDTCIRFITSSQRMHAVFDSPGYKQLEITYPTVALEIKNKCSGENVSGVENANPVYDETDNDIDQVSGERDSNGESRSALPVLHWLTSSLSLIW